MLRSAGMLLGSIFFALLVALAGVSTAGPEMDKAHLPKKPFKIYKGHLSADQERCLRYALKQWVMYDSAPVADGAGNRNETSDNVTTAGPRHDLSDAKDHARSSRSLSAAEKKLMEKAYGKNSPFHQPGQPVKDPTKDDSWFTDDEGAADLSIEPGDNIPGVSSTTLGLTSYSLTKGVNDENAKVEFKSRSDTLPAAIYIKENPAPGKTWCYPTDTNGDGWITNADAKCPTGTIDYYMIIKHELGHWVSFTHDDGHFDYEPPPTPSFATPASLCDSAMTLFSDKDPDVARGSEFSSRASRLYFSSNRPGGYGGMDIWYVTWDPAQNRYVRATNCGPVVNSFAEEMDPHSGIGDAELYFASNRPGGLGGFDLYRAERNSPATFDSVESLPSGVNTAFNETGPYSFLGELFFASDRPGGAGSFDLYESPIDSANIAGPPTSVGSVLNTAFNEMDPAVLGGSVDDPSEPLQLAFASDRPGGAGGMDLWAAEATAGVWTLTANLAALNTPFADSGPCGDIGLARMFLDSNRPGGHGSFDCFVSENHVARPDVLWDGDAAVSPGATAHLTFDVANTGTRSVTLQAQSFNTHGWSASYDPTPYQLQPGAVRKVDVYVTIPADAAGNDTSQVWYGVIPIGLGPQAQGGSPFPSNYAWVVATPVVGVPGAPGAPVAARLALRAQPNPFSGETRLVLTAPRAGDARIEVFDLAGRHVRTIHRGAVAAGVSSFSWDGRDDAGRRVAAGLHVCRATFGGERVSVALVMRR